MHPRKDQEEFVIRKQGSEEIQNITKYDNMKVNERENSNEPKTSICFDRKISKSMDSLEPQQKASRPISRFRIPKPKPNLKGDKRAVQKKISMCVPEEIPNTTEMSERETVHPRKNQDEFSVEKLANEEFCNSKCDNVTENGEDNNVCLDTDNVDSPELQQKAPISVSRFRIPKPKPNLKGDKRAVQKNIPECNGEKLPNSVLAEASEREIMQSIKDQDEFIVKRYINEEIQKENSIKEHNTADKESNYGSQQETNVSLKRKIPGNVDISEPQQKISRSTSRFCLPKHQLNVKQNEKQADQKITVSNAEETLNTIIETSERKTMSPEKNQDECAIEKHANEEIQINNSTKCDNMAENENKNTNEKSNICLDTELPKNVDSSESSQRALRSVSRLRIPKPKPNFKGEKRSVQKQKFLCNAEETSNAVITETSESRKKEQTRKDEDEFVVKKHTDEKNPNGNNTADKESESIEEQETNICLKRKLPENVDSSESQKQAPRPLSRFRIPKPRPNLKESDKRTGLKISVSNSEETSTTIIKTSERQTMHPRKDQDEAAMEKHAFEEIQSNNSTRSNNMANNESKNSEQNDNCLVAELSENVDSSEPPQKAPRSISRFRIPKPKPNFKGEKRTVIKQGSVCNAEELPNTVITETFERKIIQPRKDQELVVNKHTNEEIQNDSNTMVHNTADKESESTKEQETTVCLKRKLPENASSSELQHNAPRSMSRFRIPKPQPNLKESEKRGDQKKVSVCNTEETSKPITEIPERQVFEAEEISSTSDSPPSTPTDFEVQNVVEVSTMLQSPTKSPKKRNTTTTENKEVSSQRKKFNKCRNPPERSKMTMLDLIRWNPVDNPMKGSSNGNKKSKVGRNEVPVTEKQMTPNNEAEAVDDAPKANTNGEVNSLPAPRVMLGPNGEITLDEDSLVIHRTSTDISKGDVVYEDSNTTYTSFRTKATVKRGWSNKETAKFYTALRVLGTDFSLMSNLFTNRSRHELKLKFKREERYNRALVDRAINDPQQFDLSVFDNEVTEEVSVEEVKKKPAGHKKKNTEKSDQNSKLEQGSTSKNANSVHVNGTHVGKKRNKKAKTIPRTYRDESDPEEVYDVQVEQKDTHKTRYKTKKQRQLENELEAENIIDDQQLPNTEKECAQLSRVRKRICPIYSDESGSERDEIGNSLDDALGEKSNSPLSQSQVSNNSEIREDEQCEGNETVKHPETATCEISNVNTLIVDEMTCKRPGDKTNEIVDTLEDTDANPLQNSVILKSKSNSVGRKTVKPLQPYPLLVSTTGNLKNYSRKADISKRVPTPPIISSLERPSFTPERNTVTEQTFTTLTKASNQTFTIPITPSPNTSRDNSPHSAGHLVLLASQNQDKERVIHVYLVSGSNSPQTLTGNDDLPATPLRTTDNINPHHNSGLLTLNIPDKSTSANQSTIVTSLPTTPCSSTSSLLNAQFMPTVKRNPCNNLRNALQTPPNINLLNSTLSNAQLQFTPGIASSLSNSKSTFTKSMPKSPSATDLLSTKLLSSAKEISNNNLKANKVHITRSVPGSLPRHLVRDISEQIENEALDVENNAVSVEVASGSKKKTTLPCGIVRIRDFSTIS